VKSLDFELILQYTARSTSADPNLDLESEEGQRHLNALCYIDYRQEEWLRRKFLHEFWAIGSIVANCCGRMSRMCSSFSHTFTMNCLGWEEKMISTVGRLHRQSGGITQRDRSPLA
jgi:hypothetical protein